MSKQDRWARRATIANGESLSNALDLTTSAAGVVGIQMPADWTAASLTFEASADGTTYSPVYTTDGDEVTCAADADRWIPIVPGDLCGMNYLKVRSGTSGTPVNQGAERVLVLAVRSL